MKPASYNLVFTRGDDYRLKFRVRERIWNEEEQQYEPGPYIILTDWVGASQVRVTADATDVKTSPTITFEPDQDDADNRGIGYLDMTAAQTAILEDDWVYDVELTDAAGKKHTYLAGKTKAKKDVTRV